MTGSVLWFIRRNMGKMGNTINQFMALKAALEAERDSIRSRLQALDAILGSSANLSAAPRDQMSVGSLAPRRRGRPPGRRNAPKTADAGGEQKFGLREAVRQAIANRALSIRELVPAVERLGYRFSSKDPVNSLGAYLYSKRGQEHFRKTNDGFVAR